MAQVFNPQWNSSMDVDDALMERMEQDNFMTCHTGGGCMAWERLTDDEDGSIMITDDAQLGSWDRRNQPVWMVGRYNADGDFLCVGGCTLELALELADKMRAPVEGEGEVFDATNYVGKI